MTNSSTTSCGPAVEKHYSKGQLTTG